jgi:hypothetical protein
MCLSKQAGWRALQPTVTLWMYRLLALNNIKILPILAKPKIVSLSIQFKGAVMIKIFIFLNESARKTV